MSRRRKRGPDPVPVGGAIQGVLADLGLEASARALRVVACWSEVVGPEEARHAAPGVLRGSVLDVVVDSSVWCQQLALRRDEILARFARSLGAGAPTELRFQVGQLLGPARG